MGVQHKRSVFALGRKIFNEESACAGFFFCGVFLFYRMRFSMEQKTPGQPSWSLEINKIKPFQLSRNVSMKYIHASFWFRHSLLL